jgi:hypothetical protein
MPGFHEGVQLMSIRQRLQLALWLQQFWQRQALPFPEMTYQWEVLKSRWYAAERALSQCQLANQHRLQLCLPMLRQALLSALSNLSEQIAVLRDSYALNEQMVVPPRHWYEEVVQLEEEFNRVTFNAKEDRLRVETPSITLENICLGAFAIEMVKEDSELSMQCIQIVALDPEPANTDPDVVHPHVKNGELCTGDAKVPIRKALESGRVTDAFLLILSTLQTYNHRSAYVTLAQWHGINCSSCSRTSSSEDSFHCHRCQCALCDECYSSCTSCSETACPGCIQGCAVCHADFCDACLETSEVSDRSLCSKCRTSCSQCSKVLSIRELQDNDLCLVCSEQEDSDDPENSSPELETEPSQEVLAP